ncbi:MAG: NAD(P)/FAD-dependent oxidoreductase [Gemmatimonadota bacterium]|nr:NAD(P)/FAD-dependent oxidoreductase [Gemmatimonadota bacterium]MDE3173818.1 NAD(P)/FAD-dependent oxidoreductase [Gemmatimonadota bacterium]
MADRFDLIVIGTGSAGAGPAQACRRAGWRVAVVDDQPYGGTCANRGCDPKKVLVGAAEVVDWTRRMAGHGVTGSAAMDWPALMAFKRGFTDPVPSNREERLRAAGITTLHGEAHFVAPDALDVGGDRFHADHLVIAAGSEPRALGIPGAHHVRTSTDFLDLDRLPGRIAFIGAGYISLEFAHIARRAGAEVTVVGRGRPLEQFDHEVVDRLAEHTRAIGIDLRTDTTVTRVDAVGGAYRVHLSNAERTESVDADLVVHGAGRVPATRRLGLEAADVGTTPAGGVQVTEFLLSPTNPRVYAAGDVAVRPGGAPFTPVAGYEGRIVAENLLHGNRRRADYGPVPSVAFTIPPLAAVGLTEHAAERAGRKVRIERHDTSAWYSNRRIAAEHAMTKVLIDAETERIVGAHLLGHHAEEVINLFAMAMRYELPAQAVREQIYAYPTSSSDVPYMV